VSGQSVEERLGHAVQRGDVQWFATALTERMTAKGETPLTVEGLAFAALAVADDVDQYMSRIFDHAQREATLAIIGGLRTLAFALVRREILDPLEQGRDDGGHDAGEGS